MYSLYLFLQKLHVFLFDEVLVVTRLNSQSGQQTFQVYRQPIPVDQLVVTDLKDGEVKMGSFRSAFGSGQTGKISFSYFINSDIFIFIYFE